MSWPADGQSTELVLVRADMQLQAEGCSPTRATAT